MCDRWSLLLEKNHLHTVYIVCMRGERWPVSPLYAQRRCVGWGRKQLGTANKAHDYPHHHMSNGCCLLGLACINLQPTWAVNWFRLSGSYVRDAALMDWGDRDGVVGVSRAYQLWWWGTLFYWTCLLYACIFTCGFTCDSLRVSGMFKDILCWDMSKLFCLCS